MKIKPLKLFPSTMIFISAAVLLWIMTHLCIPFLSEITGLEPILFWFICGGFGVFIPLIIAGAIMLRKEGCKFTKDTFVERLRCKLLFQISAIPRHLCPWNHCHREDIGCYSYGCHIGCSISEVKSSFGVECCCPVKRSLSETKRGFCMEPVGLFFISRLAGNCS